MPFNPDSKSPGDLIRSAEWNEAMDEITRLGGDKLDVAGGTVQGDLATTGALGVGTAAPVAKVHVQDGSAYFEHTNDPSARKAHLTLKTIYNADASESIFTIDVAENAGLANLVAGAQPGQSGTTHVYQSDRGASRIRMDDGTMRFYIGATTGVPGQTVAWNERMRIHTNGNVGIGTTKTTAPLTLPGGPDVTPTSGGALHIGSTSAVNMALDNNEIMVRDNGVGQTLHLGKHVKVDGNLTVNGSWNNPSSRALKQDIVDVPLAEAVAAVSGLRPVSFRYKREPDTRRLGFIAEDVPDLVANEDRETVDIMKILTALTRVVQHQQEEIDALKKRLKES